MAELTLADLWENCTECGGDGLPKPPAPVVLKPGEKLEPRKTMVTSTASCPKCNGRRGKPTATGKAILDFINKAKSDPVRANMHNSRPSRQPV